MDIRRWILSKKTDNKENRYMIARKSAKKKINQAEVESELHICHDKFSKIENGYIFPDAIWEAPRQTDHPAPNVFSVSCQAVPQEIQHPL